MNITPNEYLDARQAEWLDAEVSGLVRYDCVTKLIAISPQAKDITTYFVRAQIVTTIGARV